MARAMRFGLLLLAILAGPSASFGGLIQYTITVDVTAAPHSPGLYPTNPWSFASLPATFVGTFDADNSVPGAISNLALTIGGLDIATSHPIIAVDSFDPNSLTLQYGALDPTHRNSFVGFNNTFFGGQPSNYAVAVENNVEPPRDQFSGFTQNWVGTFAVSTAAVPEPSPLLVTSFLFGVFGVVWSYNRFKERAATA